MTQKSVEKACFANQTRRIENGEEGRTGCLDGCLISTVESGRETILVHTGAAFPHLHLARTIAASKEFDKVGNITLMTLHPDDYQKTKTTSSTSS